MRNPKLLKLLGLTLPLLFLIIGVLMLQTTGLGWAPWSTRAEAANPNNPCAPKRSNPCNPCSAKRVNPCNPRVAKSANPCNPCASKRPNPCNPCSAKRANPCNPRAAKSANPCNPCAPKAGPKSAALISWGRDYVVYERTTGFVFSASHGGRLVVTYVAPKEAAKVYRGNAKLVRKQRNSGFQTFPQGTVIVKESFVKDHKGGPGQRGPVFFMRKEAKGYDPAGGNWRYAFTKPDFKLIGEGKTGNVAFCRGCHVAVKNRDMVYAVDR